jgi:hypothetical protein
VVKYKRPSPARDETYRRLPDAGIFPEAPQGLARNNQILELILVGFKQHNNKVAENS